jgi:hypothetical protein
MSDKSSPSLPRVKGCPDDCNLNHPIAVYARQQAIGRSTVYRLIEQGMPVLQTRLGRRINCQQARAFILNKPQA